MDQVQVNLIYNTNRNLFLWIEIFISITDLYKPTIQLLTDGPATCRIGIKPETGNSVQVEDLLVTYALHL